MTVSKEGKVGRVQVAQLILSQTAKTTKIFTLIFFSFLVKLVNYLGTIANTNHCRIHRAIS